MRPDEQSLSEEHADPTPLPLPPDELFEDEQATTIAATGKRTPRTLIKLRMMARNVARPAPPATRFSRSSVCYAVVMPRVRELPPPPEHPVQSPPASVEGEELVTIPGIDGGPSLEARMRVPAAAERAVVLCHPHPLYGGTMHSAVVLAIAKVLAERGGSRVAHLRFNYRGVGASEGRYAEGLGEIDDARAALQVLRAQVPRAKVTVCGYSFGTFVGLRAAVIDGGVERVALVAPAVRVFHFVKEDGAAFQGRLAIFVGDDDEFCDVSEAEELATALGARLTVFPGADHYFLNSRRKLAEAVVPVVAPEAGTLSPA